MTQTFNILANLLRTKNKETQTEKPLYEQLKNQIELAEEFDRLQAFSGWEKVLKYMGAEINATLAEATKYPLDPEKQRLLCNQWNAKRQLLDNALGYIDSTQAERDRIVEEYREMENARPATSGN